MPTKTRTGRIARRDGRRITFKALVVTTMLTSFPYPRTAHLDNPTIRNGHPIRTWRENLPNSNASMDKAHIMRCEERRGQDPIKEAKFVTTGTGRGVILHSDEVFPPRLCILPSCPPAASSQLPRHLPALLIYRGASLLRLHTLPSIVISPLSSRQCDQNRP